MAGGLSLFASGNSSHGENGPDGNGSAKGLRCLPQKDKLIMETKMHRTCLVAVAALGFATVAFAADEHKARPRADQPAAPAVPPASGSLSSDLNRSGGVITPPAGIDPEIKQTPPPTGAKMPVIPPPGTPGGNPLIKPK